MSTKETNYSRRAVLAAVASAALTARPAAADDNALVVRSDFEAGSAGWLAGYSDYSLQTSGMAFLAEVRPLPEELGVSGHGYYLQGANRSDDLFMYLKRALTNAEGVQPGVTYRVSFEIEFASDAGVGCVGIGGAPGESVYLKAGASPVEPVSILEGDELRLNLDKGNQAAGGHDLGVVSNVANGEECRGVGVPYKLLQRTYEHPEPVKAREDGTLWVVLGTDSGYEGQTGLYYRSIVVTLCPVAE